MNTRPFFFYNLNLSIFLALQQCKMHGYVRYDMQSCSIYREHKLTSASAHGFKSLKNLKHCVPNFSQPVGHLLPKLKESAIEDRVKTMYQFLLIDEQNVRTFIKESRNCKPHHRLQFKEIQKLEEFSLFCSFTFRLDSIYSQCKKKECCRNPHSDKVLLISRLL